MSLSKEATEVLDLLKDPERFVRSLLILTKKKKQVPFIPTPQQLEVLRACVSGVNVFVLKARQLGITTIVRAYHLWKALTTPNQKLVFMAHKHDSAYEIFDITKKMVASLPEVIKRAFEIEITAMCVKIKANGSELKASYAGASGGSRGTSISGLHVTELLEFGDATEFRATEMSSLNGQQWIIESTAAHKGDPVHVMWEEYLSVKDEPGFNDAYFFFPWHEQEEYRTPVDGTFRYTEEEEKLVEMYGLEPEQVLWRRNKIKDLTLSKFMCEYPFTVDDIFSNKEGTFFSASDLSRIQILAARVINGTCLEASPLSSNRHGMGVDIGAGAGKDYSSIHIIDQRTGKVVYLWRSNTTKPNEFVNIIYELYRKYNGPIITIEVNGIGASFPSLLLAKGVRSSDIKEWTNSEKNKFAAFNELRKAILEDTLKALDSITKGELERCTVNDRGVPEFSRSNEGHGDSAISLVLAWQSIKALPSLYSAGATVHQLSTRNFNQR